MILPSDSQGSRRMQKKEDNSFQAISRWEIAQLSTPKEESWIGSGWHKKKKESRGVLKASRIFNHTSITGVRRHDSPPANESLTEVWKCVCCCSRCAALKGRTHGSDTLNENSFSHSISSLSDKRPVKLLLFQMFVSPTKVFIPLTLDFPRVSAIACFLLPPSSPSPAGPPCTLTLLLVS